MPIDQIWAIGRAAAERLDQLYHAEHVRLRELGLHAAAYTGLATGRTLGGFLPGDGEQVVYGQGRGWGGEALPERSPLQHVYEEFRHWRDGDSLQWRGGSGLPLKWCRKNVKVLAVELPNKACLKVTEMWLHTLIFRRIRSGDLRSLVYQPLPDASYTGLLSSSIHLGRRVGRRGQGLCLPHLRRGRRRPDPRRRAGGEADAARL